MNSADLTSLRVWAEGNRKALEWKVGDRTFQIMGAHGAEGLYERFFHAPPAHATRQKVSVDEILSALTNATSRLAFWHNETDRVWFENAEAALKAAKAWLAQH